MLTFLQRLFGREDSSKTAKDRLRLVLVHDRSSVSPQVLDALKEELIKVISKYMEIEMSGIEVSLDSEDDSVALIANIPIREVKRGLERVNS